MANVSVARASWHHEDLSNVAAVGNLLHGGAVYSLPSHLMTGPIAAAALRYQDTEAIKILVAVDSSDASAIATR